MPSVRIVRDPREAALLAAPVRQRILEALASPGSASTVAKTLGLARQNVAYHLRKLESSGFVTLVREEQRRGCRERIVERTSRYLVPSNEVFGSAGLDHRRLKDRFSSEYLIALATRMSREVGVAQEAAERCGAALPTLSAHVEIRLRSPRDRQQFGLELGAAVQALAAKFHDESHPGGRRYRLVVGAYPIRDRKPGAAPESKETP